MNNPSGILDMTGRTAVVTGANTGMGKETARALAGMGCEVVLACRSAARGESARDEIVASAGSPSVHTMPLDLSSMASVRAFANTFCTRFENLDILVNSAAASLRTREITEDGFERHWGTNVVGPHLLTRLLLPALQRSGRGRIVNVSTRAAGGLDLTDTQYEHRRYSGVGAYRASKQAVRMLTWALAVRLEDAPITANAVSPGYVLTDLTTNVEGPLRMLVRVTRFWAKTPLQGADTTIWLASSPDVDGITGAFWSSRRRRRCRFRDPEAFERLWHLVDHQAHMEQVRLS